jgi:hypothetical protein
MHQSNQSACQRKCFFALARRTGWALCHCAQIIQNRRLEICPYYLCAPLTCNGKIPMPFSRPLPISSEFFFAEAVPLTGEMISSVTKPLTFQLHARPSVLV